MLLRNLSEVYKKGLLSMSDLYNRIEELCLGKKISITTMCKESGANRASLSDLKAGRKQGLSADTLSKIARYFGVSIDFLLDREQFSNTVFCRECGFQYDSSDFDECTAHENRHRLWAAAVDKYGFCWEQRYREEEKLKSYAIIENSASTDQACFDAQIVIFKALFSRSLEHNGFSVEHPDFRTYIAMSLSQSIWKKRIRPAVYKKMTDIYGVKPGMERGAICPLQEKAPTPQGERSVTDDDIKFALFGGRGDITDAMYEEVKRFAAFVAEREAEKE